MSCVEIYGFNKNGIIEEEREVRNAMRGSMLIWQHIEKKYLPSLKPLYGWESDNYRSRFFTFSSDKLDEFWNLITDKKVSEVDRIVLGSTYDNVLIKKDNIEKLLNAYEKFEGESNLKEQILAIKDLFKNRNIIALGYNQTSVNSNPWWEYNEEKEDEENYFGESYNFLTGKRHWWLFERIKEINKINISTEK